jgi:galactose mutarotase-like enzyme
MIEVEIAAADQRAVVVGAGGGLRAYAAGGRDLVDGFPAEGPITSGRGQVLIPWPNRLEDGAYEFDGRSHQLPLTEPERGNAIHGLVRDAAWTVGERKPHRVVMEHVLEPQPGYPFTLSLAVEYALSEAGLEVRTTATNSGPDACPFGSGQHPYLTLGTPTVDSLILCAPGRTVLRAASPSTGPSTTSAARARSGRRRSTTRSRTWSAAWTGVRASSWGIPRVVRASPSGWTRPTPGFSSSRVIRSRTSRAGASPSSR